MKVITHSMGTREPITYKVYENEQEVEAAGVETSFVLHQTEIGQYYRFDNGVYAPLINKKVYEQRKGSTIYEYVFPKFKFSRRGENYRIGVSYRIGIEAQGILTKPRRFSVKDTYFVQLLTLGVDVDIAFTEVYGIKDRTRKYVKLDKVFNHPRFQQSILKDDVMGRMKKQLEDIGVDDAYLAQALKDIIDNEDPKNAALKRFAIEKSMDLLEMNKQESVKEEVVSQSASIADTLRLRTS